MFKLYNPMEEGTIYTDGAGEAFNRGTLTTPYLDEATFLKVIESTPIPCTDILWIDPAKRVLYLAWRTVYAVQGPWMFGGRQRRGETPREAATRLLKDETGTDIDPDDLQFVQWVIYFSKFRKQLPQDAGVHNIFFHFCYVASEELLASKQTKLDPNEYDLAHGIRPYTRTDLESLDPNGPYSINRAILLQEFERIFGPEYR